MVQISILIGVDVQNSNISAAHKLQPKRYSKAAEPPASIARFINRNLRNEIYSKQTVAKQLKEADFFRSRNEKIIY